MLHEEHFIDGTARIRLAAGFPGIDAIDARVAQILRAAGVVEDVFPLRIVLREALLNAVVHGSGEDPSRTVEVSVQVVGDRVVLTVQDEGPGFSTDHLPGGFDILGDGGRGIALMRIHADELAHEDGGRRVRFSKRIGRGAPGAHRRNAKAS